MRRLDACRRGAGVAAFAAWSLLSGGCMMMGRGVNLTYAPSKNVIRTEHRTPIAILPFIDKRENPGLIGQVPMMLVFKEPLRTFGDVAVWAKQAAVLELSNMGYKIVPEAEWKVGGVIREVSCVGGKKIACSVKMELWVRMKDNWEVLKHEYRGEGSMPPLFKNADLYEQSLEEALRDVLINFRRDLELAVP